MLHCPKSPKNTKPGQKWPELLSPATHGKNAHTPTGTHTQRHKHTALLLCSVRCINSQEALKSWRFARGDSRTVEFGEIPSRKCWSAGLPKLRTKTQHKLRCLVNLQKPLHLQCSTPGWAFQVGLPGEKKQEHFKWTEVWFSNFICEQEKHGPSHNLSTRS